MGYKKHVLNVVSILLVCTSFVNANKPFENAKTNNNYEITELETGRKDAKLFLIAGGTGVAMAGMFVGFFSGKWYCSREILKLKKNVDDLNGKNLKLLESNKKLFDNFQKVRDLNDKYKRLNNNINRTVESNDGLFYKTINGAKDSLNYILGL